MTTCVPRNGRIGYRVSDRLNRVQCPPSSSTCSSSPLRATAADSRSRVNTNFAVIRESCRSPPSVGFSFQIDFGISSAAIAASSPSSSSSPSLSLLPGPMKHRTMEGNEMEKQEKTKGKKERSGRERKRDGRGFVSISSTALNDLALGNLIDTGQTSRPDFKRVCVRVGARARASSSPPRRVLFRESGRTVLAWKSIFARWTERR